VIRISTIADVARDPRYKVRETAPGHFKADCNIVMDEHTPACEVPDDWDECCEIERERLLRVARQRRDDGRTGGGMACPACGRRGLKMLNEERVKGAPTRMFCEPILGTTKGGCGAEVLLTVRAGQIVLQGGGVTTWNGQEMDVPF
jgi:hypothetical protein